MVSEDSFFDALLGQLELKELTDRQRVIAQEIVGSIDDAGYVSRSTDHCRFPHSLWARSGCRPR